MKFRRSEIYIPNCVEEELMKLIWDFYCYYKSDYSKSHFDFDDYSLMRRMDAIPLEKPENDNIFMMEVLGFCEDYLFFSYFNFYLKQIIFIKNKTWFKKGFYFRFCSKSHQIRCLLRIDELKENEFLNEYYKVTIYENEKKKDMFPSLSKNDVVNHLMNKIACHEFHHVYNEWVNQIFHDYFYFENLLKDMDYD